MFSEVFINFCVSRNWLGNFCFWVLIPVVSPAMSDKDATKLFNLFDQIFSLSRNLKFCDFTNAGDNSAGKFFKNIF